MTRPDRLIDGESLSAALAEVLDNEPTDCHTTRPTGVLSMSVQVVYPTITPPPPT